MNKFLNVLASYTKYNSIEELLDLSQNMILDDIYVSRLYQTFYPKGYEELSLKETCYVNKIILSNKRYFDDNFTLKFILYIIIKISFQGCSCIGFISNNKDSISKGIFHNIDINHKSDIELLKGTKYDIQFCNGSSIHIMSDHRYCKGRSIQYLFVDKSSYNEYDNIRKNILSELPYVTKIIEF